MKIILMIGSHPRHLYIARKLFHAGLLGGLIVENRSNFLPTPSPSLPKQDQANFVRHFLDRKIAEDKAFGDTDIAFFSTIPVLQVQPTELNG